MKEITIRGFKISEFKDSYGHTCSIQASSLLGHIWLGIDKVEPKVLAREAAMVGVETTKTVGWVDYPISDNVQLSSRMHLSTDQVKALLPTLIKFAETGEM